MSAPSVPPPVPSRANRRSVQLQQEQQQGEQPQSHTEEEQYDYQPVDLTHGEPLEGETVAPNCYKWYRVNVQGTEDDIVDFKLTRYLQAGAINLYVNLPTTEDYPTREQHDWNPTMGPLYGPVGNDDHPAGQAHTRSGEYKITVEGVPSYIENDDKWLVDPNSNWAVYDLLVECPRKFRGCFLGLITAVLDEKTKEIQQKMKELYTREKTSAVWSSGYNKEVEEKYVQQQKEYEQELLLREKQLQEATEADVSLDGTPVADAYTLGSVLGRSG